MTSHVSAAGGGKTYMQCPTAIAVVYKDGVLVAACSGVSRGELRICDDADRIAALENRLLLTGSGQLAHLQSLISRLAAESREVEFLGGQRPSVKQLAFAVARLLYRERLQFRPKFVNTIVAGMQDGAPYLARVDLHGTRVEESFAVTGLGNWFAINLLRNELDPQMDLESAKNVVMRCFAVLAAADASVGSFANFKTVSADGVQTIGAQRITPNKSALEHLKADRSRELARASIVG